jgi:multiple sugar transport system substrate-binding protein
MRRSGRAPRLSSRLIRPFLAAALCALIVLPTSARLVQARTSQSDKVTLVFYNQWIGVQEKYLQEIIRRFEKLHPNITIKESVVADTTKIIAAMQGGQPPDIVDFGLGQFLPEMASKGALTNLDSYIKAAHVNLSVFVPKSLEVDTYNGHVYGLPFMDFNHALIYNTDLFKKAGISHPPTTLEELTADAYKLTKQDASGKIEQMGFIPDWPGGANGQAVNLVDYGWLFGGDWYNAKTQQPTADLPQNIKALDWETQIYKKYGAKNIDNFVKSAGAYLSNDVFASGKLAMAYDGEWWLDFAPPSFVPKIGVVPFPAPQGLSKYTGTSFLDNDPQVIPSGSKHKQEAFEFLQYQSTDPSVTLYMAPRVYNLSQLSAIPASAISKDPRFKTFVDIANGPNAHVFPRVGYAGEMDTDIQNAEAAALHGQGNAASVLHSLQSTLLNSATGQ